MQPLHWDLQVARTACEILPRTPTLRQITDIPLFNRSSAKDPMQQTTAELQHYASVFFNETSKTMVNQLFDMMWANDSKTQDKVNSMMLDGGMWNMSNVFANDPTSLQSNQNRIFWGKMLPEVWKLSDEPMNAFIM